MASLRKRVLRALVPDLLSAVGGLVNVAPSDQSALLQSARSKPKCGKSKPVGNGRPVWNHYGILIRETVRLSRSGTPAQRAKALRELKLARQLSKITAAVVEEEYLEDLELRYSDYRSTALFALHLCWDSWWALRWHEMLGWLAGACFVIWTPIHVLVQEIKIYRPQRAARDVHTYWLHLESGLYEPAASTANIEHRILKFAFLFVPAAVVTGIVIVDRWYDAAFPFDGDWHVFMIGLSIIPLCVWTNSIATLLRPHDVLRHRTHRPITNITGLPPSNLSNDSEVAEKMQRNHFRLIREKHERGIARGIELKRRQEACDNQNKPNSSIQWNYTGAYNYSSSKTECINGTYVGAGHTGDDCSDCGTCGTECQNDAIIPNSKLTCWSPAGLAISLIIIFAVFSIILTFCLCKRHSSARTRAAAASPTPANVPAGGATGVQSAPDLTKFLDGLCKSVQKVATVREALERAVDGPVRDPVGQSEESKAELELLQEVGKALKEDLKVLRKGTPTSHGSLMIYEAIGCIMAMHWLARHWHDRSESSLSAERVSDRSYFTINEAVSLRAFGSGASMAVVLYELYHQSYAHAHEHYIDHYHEMLHGALPQPFPYTQEGWNKVAMATIQHDIPHQDHLANLEADWKVHVPLFKLHRPNLCPPNIDDPDLRINWLKLPFLYCWKSNCWFHSSAVRAALSDAEIAQGMDLRHLVKPGFTVANVSIVRQIIDWAKNKVVHKNAEIFALLHERSPIDHHVKMSGDDTVKLLPAMLHVDGKVDVDRERSVVRGIVNALRTCLQTPLKSLGSSYEVQPSMMHVGHDSTSKLFAAKLLSYAKCPVRRGISEGIVTIGRTPGQIPPLPPDMPLERSPLPFANVSVGHRASAPPVPALPSVHCGLHDVAKVDNRYPTDIITQPVRMPGPDLNAIVANIANFWFALVPTGSAPHFLHWNPEYPPEHAEPNKDVPRPVPAAVTQAAWPVDPETNAPLWAEFTIPETTGSAMAWPEWLRGFAKECMVTEMGGVARPDLRMGLMSGSMAYNRDNFWTFFASRFEKAATQSLQTGDALLSLADLYAPLDDANDRWFNLQVGPESVYHVPGSNCPPPRPGKNWSYKEYIRWLTSGAAISIDKWDTRQPAQVAPPNPYFFSATMPEANKIFGPYMHSVNQIALHFTVGNSPIGQRILEVSRKPENHPCCDDLEILTKPVEPGSAPT